MKIDDLKSFLKLIDNLMNSFVNSNKIKEIQSKIKIILDELWQEIEILYKSNQNDYDENNDFFYRSFTIDLLSKYDIDYLNFNNNLIEIFGNNSFEKISFIVYCLN